MINNFIVKTQSGLYCIPGDFYLDPRRSVHRALVTHAHGDHAVPTGGQVYCTPPTESFFRYRYQGRVSPDFVSVQFEKSFSIRNVEIVFYPAGHILGSAQILMIFEGQRYLYTGDFKIQSDESCEPFRFIECDHLITESTFASPDYSHPDPVTELKNLLSEGKNILLGAYALGKAQRLTRLITSHCSENSVYIHPDLEAYHRIYSDHGFSLGDWRKFNRSEYDSSNQSVLIVSPQHFRRYRRSPDQLKVFATGWKKSFYSCDRVLNISDHADWPGLLELIRRSRAEKVYTVHGDGSMLKNHLKDTVDVKIIG